MLFEAENTNEQALLTILTPHLCVASCIIQQVSSNLAVSHFVLVDTPNKWFILWLTHCTFFGKLSGLEVSTDSIGCTF